MRTNPHGRGYGDWNIVGVPPIVPSPKIQEGLEHLCPQLNLVALHWVLVAE
jgi:hypothetical protein